MTIATVKAEARRSSTNRLMPWLGMGLCLLLLISHLFYDAFAKARAVSGDGGGAVSPAAERAPAAPTMGSTVSLPPAKQGEAKIATERARLERLPVEVPVVGVIQINSDSKVDVRPWAAGIVRQVHVVYGQNVKRGDPLITLDSPEIGTARLNLRAKQRELATARFEAAWKSAIAANVELLIPMVKRGIEERRAALTDDEEHTDRPVPQSARAKANPPPAAYDAKKIESEFANKQLGTYRGTLLQAFAEFDIASHEEQKTKSLRSQNILGEHPALVARHTREGIQAKLEAAVEQVRFDAAQEKRIADLKVGQAEAAVIDAAQRLRILGVPEDIQALLDHADKASAIARDEDVTFYRIVAPFDGTIVKKWAVPSQKAETNDILFELADLKSVWVTANISESDVGRLSQIADGSIRLSATAYPNRFFPAKLLSVGKIVDPQTRTVPLLAQSDNSLGLLIPGMFVRIFLDRTTGEPALTIPASAVVEIETENYVFVPSGKGPGDDAAFSLKPVEIGQRTSDRVVIKAGLKVDDEVVSSGAFFLKSELILKSQPEED
jgi:membrane fusion protein, heavy metal efflux system